MSGKQNLKAELTEELMEVAAIQSNFAKDVGDILTALGSNETLDHQNDIIRNEVMGFMLQGLEAYNAKDYEGMQKYLHAAIQKLNKQGVVDVKDDQPRNNAKVKLLQVQIKAIHNEERIRKLTAKFGGFKDASPTKE
jgi:hypothetical protein